MALCILVVAPVQNLGKILGDSVPRKTLRESQGFSGSSASSKAVHLLQGGDGGWLPGSVDFIF